jgi:uncharacterized membrane protein
MLMLINSYSFVGLGLLIVLIGALISWRLGSPVLVVVTVAVTLVALVSFQLTASTKFNTVSNAENFNRALATGKPVLLELYSNY